MSSILARQLGAGGVQEARATYSAAHGLAAFMGLFLIMLFFAFGKPAALLAAGGSEELTAMGLI